MHMDHMKYTYNNVTNHTCSAHECYGLTMQKADGWLQLYTQLRQRTLDIATTRAIYHRNIIPQAVLQPATALQLRL